MIRRLQPRLAKLPLTSPQVKATNLGLASRYCRSLEACTQGGDLEERSPTLARNLKQLSWRT